MAAVVPLPSIGRTPANMLTEAEKMMASPSAALSASQERTDSPPTDDRPASPIAGGNEHGEALAAQQALVASLGAAVQAADAGPCGDWLSRREAQSKKMADRVKARKLAAAETEARAREAEKALKHKKREHVRRRAEKNLRQAEEAAPTAAVLGAMITNETAGAGTEKLHPLRRLAAAQQGGNKEQRRFGGNQGSGNARAVLTRKLEAAKARQQATAARQQAFQKRQADALTSLGAALAVAESGTPGAMPPLAEALKVALKLQAPEDGAVLRAKDLLKDAKAKAKAAADAQASAAAEAAAIAQAQAAAQAAAERATLATAQAAAEAQAMAMAQAMAVQAQPSATTQAAQQQAAAALAAAAQATPVRAADLPAELPAELDFRSPRGSPAAAAPAEAAAALTTAAVALPVPAPPAAVAAARPGVSDPRSKPLWQATAAELLAELLRRQTQPAMAPAAAAAASGSLSPTPTRRESMVLAAASPAVAATAAATAAAAALVPNSAPTPAAAAAVKAHMGPLQGYKTEKDQAEADVLAAAEVRFV